MYFSHTASLSEGTHLVLEGVGGPRNRTPPFGVTSIALISPGNVVVGDAYFITMSELALGRELFCNT